MSDGWGGHSREEVCIYSPSEVQWLHQRDSKELTYVATSRQATAANITHGEIYYTHHMDTDVGPFPFERGVVKNPYKELELPTIGRAWRG